MASNGKGLLKNGFRILPVKSYNQAAALRHILYKPHNVRSKINKTPNGRTLFVINIPPYCTKNCLKLLFQQFGEVQEVNFQRKEEEDNDNVTNTLTKHRKKAGFKEAHLVFERESHVKAAMTTKIAKPLVLTKLGAKLVTGIQKWAKEYNASIPKEAEMQSKIDEFMEAYDKKREEDIQRAKEDAGVPDEDGWVKVTRQSKRPIVLRTKAKTSKIEAREAKKRSRKELQNFYTFQIRETKMEHIAQLRKKFQADKQRIALMKESRKFKPY